MSKSLGGVVVCLLGLWGCSVERYDDCDWDDDYADHGKAGAASAGGSAGHAGGSSSGGSTSTPGGNAAGGSSGSAAGGSGGSAGTDTDSAGAADTGGTEPESCREERDCPRGYNCDLEQRECVPTDAETCPELETEAACNNRRDCVPIYGGIDCSCGQDCTCKGGEPGCICERFDFFACDTAP